tara:strand:- start:43 stop:633 length:591 start_codon:yes stop_codon:yes gene_type:complete
MPTLDEMRAAKDAAITAHHRIEQVAEAALAAADAAEGALQKAEASLDKVREVTLPIYAVRMNASERRLHDSREARTWSAYEAAFYANQAAQTACAAAWEAVVEAHDCRDRMHAWLDRPDVLTPFPFVGDEYIQPCNAYDLDYYEGRPDACPPGVREWHYRYGDYLNEVADWPGSADFLADVAQLGTMGSAETVWLL